MQSLGPSPTEKEILQAVSGTQTALNEIQAATQALEDPNSKALSLQTLKAEAKVLTLNPKQVRLGV